MRIKFLKNYGRSEGQGAGPHYEAGQECWFTDPVGIGYARAYVDRGLAVVLRDSVITQQIKAAEAEVKAALPATPVVKKPEPKIAEPVKTEPKEAAKTEAKDVPKTA